MDFNHIESSGWMHNKRSIFFKKCIDSIHENIIDKENAIILPIKSLHFSPLHFVIQQKNTVHYFHPKLQN